MWQGSIYILTENTIYFQKKTIAEEGLAILIQENDQEQSAILFDLGRRWHTLSNNLRVLDIPLGSIKTVVLSHGHAGHIGALEDALPHLNHPQLILHPGIFDLKVKKSSKGFNKANTFINYDQVVSHSSLVQTTEPVQVSNHIWTSGQIPINNSAELESTDTEKYWRKREEKLEIDDFIEETAIFIKTSLGLLIVTACSHRGIINTIEHAQKLFPGEQIAGIIGGLHLLQRPETTTYVSNCLAELNVQYVMPCHCTGFWGKRELSLKLPAHFYQIATGSRIDIGANIRVFE